MGTTTPCVNIITTKLAANTNQACPRSMSLSEMHVWVAIATEYTVYPDSSAVRILIPASVVFLMGVYWNSSIKTNLTRVYKGTSQEVGTLLVLVCLVMVSYKPILPIFFKVPSLALSQSYDYSNAINATQGFFLLNSKTPYPQISWSLVAARSDGIVIVSLLNLTGCSRGACQILERFEKLKPESCCFETSGDLAVYVLPLSE